MTIEALGPPYGPPANLRTIFRSWRERGLPGRVDRGWFERVGLSGNLATRNLHALRYLRLIDEVDHPTELAEKLRLAPSDAYALTLAAIVRTAYARIWATCDPATATRAQIDDAFRHESPPAQRSRMVACFVGLCAEAGLRTADRPEPQRRSAIRSVAVSPPLRAAAPEKAPVVLPPGATTIGDPLGLLLAKFPDFDPAWPDSVKEKWFDAFARLRDDLAGR